MPQKTRIIGPVRDWWRVQFHLRPFLDAHHSTYAEVGRRLGVTDMAVASWDHKKEMPLLAFKALLASMNPKDGDDVAEKAIVYKSRAASRLPSVVEVLAAQYDTQHAGHEFRVRGGGKLRMTPRPPVPGLPASTPVPEIAQAPAAEAIPSAKVEPPAISAQAAPTAVPVTPAAPVTPGAANPMDALLSLLSYAFAQRNSYAERALAAETRATLSEDRARAAEARVAKLEADLKAAEDLLSASGNLTVPAPARPSVRATDVAATINLVKDRSPDFASALEREFAALPKS